MSVLPRALIRESEKAAVESGAFSFTELMHIAGTKAAEAIKKFCGLEGKKIAVICGNGNNGGDGFVIADNLKKFDCDVTVIIPFGTPHTSDAEFYFSRLEGIKITEYFVDEYDLIIDSLFGIGFNREPDNTTKMLFGFINNSKAEKISIDIPSGVDCDNGKVWDEAIKADITLTFIAYKPCFLLPVGCEYCGKVEVIDIGVPPLKSNYGIIKKPHFEKRAKNSHKGDFGTAVLFSGSYGMAGAAMLAGKSALRSGLGIAKCVLPKSIYPAFTSYLPEAVCVPIDDNENGTISFNNEEFKKLIKNCNAVLFGPGCGQSIDIDETVAFLLNNSEKPMVFDADGINAIANRIEILRKKKAPVILTPHPGEMARLCKTTVAEIEHNRIAYASEFARKYDCIVVLKGSNTIVALPQGKLSFNIKGNAGMATGGTGDVLAGIIVSLAAQGHPPHLAAEYGVYLHSAAADRAAEKRSQHALIPSDIIEEL